MGMIDIADAANMDVSARPVVTLGYAQTLDGCLATSTGSSKWITAHDVDMILEGRIEYPDGPANED